MSLRADLQALEDAFPEQDTVLPTLFVGHGSPMNAVESNVFSQTWETVGAALPRPEAILCISAHWETRGTYLTAMERPKTIHDFGGFPPELFAVDYPAPGSPALARLTKEMLEETTEAGLTDKWGLDHGAWSVLCRMFPAAQIPVVQLSLDRDQPASFHYELGRALRPLRKRGVLVVTSGNIVHNLRLAKWDDSAAGWAQSFDALSAEKIQSGDDQALVNYESLGAEARLAIPTPEHYLPLLYTLGLREKSEAVGFFNEGVTLSSISMRSVRLG
jgi:4,5-DOPA dioxygenase extradiol